MLVRKGRLKQNVKRRTYFFIINNEMELFSLKGKVALVTGGNGGINQKKVADGLRGRWTEGQIEECMAIQREYGATTAAFNWYRAADIGKNASVKSYEKNIIRPPYLYGERKTE